MSFKRENSAEACQALNNLIHSVEDWAVKNGDKLRRSCASCTYAHRTGPFKCAVYRVTPPLDVIMNGCDSYSDYDQLPF